MILPVLFEEEGAQYVTQFTRNVHLLVNEVASLAIYLMELLSALIIVFTTVRAFIKLLRLPASWPVHRPDLQTGQ